MLIEQFFQFLFRCLYRPAVKEHLHQIIPSLKVVFFRPEIILQFPSDIDIRIFYVLYISSDKIVVISFVVDRIPGIIIHIPLLPLTPHRNQAMLLLHCGIVCFIGAFTGAFAVFCFIDTFTVLYFIEFSGGLPSRRFTPGNGLRLFSRRSVFSSVFSSNRTAHRHQADQ